MTRSPALAARPIRLTPLAQVDIVSDTTVATGTEPWLSLDWLRCRTVVGRFVEITFSASFWDRPCRPVFRFARRDGSFVDRIGCAPILGRGSWTGRIPADTTTIAVSPTDQKGRFDFRIDTIRRRGLVSLLAQGSRSNPRSTRSAVLTRLIGWKPESDVNLAWAIGSTPLADYQSWAVRRARPLDLTGIDRPRFDWAAARPIRVVIVGGEDEEALRSTLLSLQSQVYPSWTARVLGGSAVVADPRVMHVLPYEADTANDEVLTVVFVAGDRLTPQALAIVAEQAARWPEACLFYGDAIERHADDRRRPVFRPGWCPHLQAGRPYLGTAYVRGVEHWTPDDRLAFLRTGRLPPASSIGLTSETVVPLRRMLVETPANAFAPPSPVPPPVCDATAAIIIPTRDHPALLERIVTSIRARTENGRYRIVVVDNGSVDPEALALLARLDQAPDVRVVRHPGAFNFSLMCNEAAAGSRDDVLVFLNDDMEIRSDAWLDRLVAHAMNPAVGAVGAKLTYPDGRLQHIGVLVGMGESAGHFGALTPGDDEGWAGRNAVVHEVSAVTGACLVVARAKFEAVGGFDAEHLPIELSDIDLCLKLNACGWRTIVDPLVHLMHEESVSRGGATLRRLDVYGGQRAIFVERWRHVLRDDPTFHPGLSLYRWEAALG